MSYGSSPSLYQVFGIDSINRGDPMGLQDQKARDVGGIPIPELWFHITPGRVEIDGRTYLVSSSGTVMDEETGKFLSDSDDRARRAREATGWTFSQTDLGALLSALERQTRLYQNRWTVGLVFDVVAAGKGPGGAVVPVAGVEGGFNLQFWLNGRNEPVAGVYSLESVTPEQQKGLGWAPIGGLNNVRGIARGGGISADIAWYLDAANETRNFNFMSDEAIIESWKGPFTSMTVMTGMKFPLGGGAAFESDKYGGVSWAIAGKGAGAFWSATDYHVLGGPYNPMNFLAFAYNKFALYGLRVDSDVRKAVDTMTSLIDNMRRRR